MNFQGENEGEDSGKFMGEVTSEELLNDSEDERGESSIIRKLINKSEKKKKELDALKRIRNAKKNELTGPYWKQKVDEIQFEDKTEWESNECKSTDTN